MTIKTVPTTPYDDQKPGTSGLRKKVPHFQQPNYVENFIQSIFDSLDDFQGHLLVIGGDGRYYNREVIQIALKMAAAAGFGRVMVGQGGLLSTPAASNVIRRYNAFGGIILSASHNPGGPNEDFGIKYNIGNGGPAPEKITEAIYERTQVIDSYAILDAPDLDLDALGFQALGKMTVEVIDPVADYAALMETLFDFPAIRAMFAGGFRMSFDAMSAITGPYATEILENRLGAPAGTVRNGTPLPDFGGHHPDPNLVHAKELYDEMMGAGRPRLRRRLRRRRRPQPHHRPRHLHHPVRLARHARGQRPPRARLRRRPQGHRPLDADQRRRRPRGREARHRPLRDADGLEVLRQPPRRRHGDDLRRGERRDRLEPRPREGRPLGGAPLAQHPRRPQASRHKSIAEKHWQEYGRNYYARHDYEGIDTAAANGLVDALRAQLDKLPGTTVNGLTVAAADDFAYHDPVDGSTSGAPGHPHPLRGRQPRRLPPLRHRHLRRDAPRLHRALRGRPRPPRPRHRRRPRRPRHRRRPPRRHHREDRPRRTGRHHLTARPLGATPTPDGTHFAVWSGSATRV